MIIEEDKFFRIITENRLLNTQRLFFSLIIGFIAGILMGYFLVITSDSNYLYHLQRKSILIENDSTFGDRNIIEHIHDEENTTVAEILYDKVKVLCWVSTKPENHATRAKYIKQTWGKRCNKLIFISSEDDEELGAIALISKPKNQEWAKVISTLKYIYENYLDEYDWFLSATESTYIIMENLRYMLSPHNSDVPIFFGCKQKSSESTNSIYMSKGAGYVLSRETIKRFNEIALPSSPGNCKTDGYGYEDLELAKCLEAIDIIAGDSRDSDSRTTFHSLNLENHLISFNGEIKEEFFDKIYYKTGVGLEYSSDYAVSFDYVAPGFMFSLEYLIYHLKPYGIWSLPIDIPTENYTIEDELEILRKSEKDRVKT